MTGLPLLIRVSGRDRPSLTRDLLQLVGRSGAVLEDMEQLVVRERLTLDVLVRLDGADPDADSALVKDVLFWGFTHGLKIDFERVAAVSTRANLVRHAVTVLGQPLAPSSLAAVAQAIAATGGNIDRIVRLATEPVTAYDLVVIAGDVEAMQRELGAVAQAEQVDVAVQVNGLERRAKRLVVMDVDSTLIMDEVIELLADEAGCEAQVADITARAMAGELDFEGSLRERVRLLAGLDEAAIDRVRRRLRLTPGARTFVRTLKRLGFVVGIVSGGFTPFTDTLSEQLGLDHAYANTLEIRDGRLTGEVLGPVVDRARKAALLAQIAAAEGVPLSQTVAVGDGANDLDMLAAAGLGIAFNAKPVVRAQADTTVSVPYLDAILFMLGIRGSDVERVGGPEAKGDPMTRTLRVAQAQVATGPDLDANLRLVADQTALAADVGARLVVFPEATMRAFGYPLREIAQPLDGPWADGVRAVAGRHELTIVAGMFTPTDDGRVTNTLLAVGPGVDAGYAKIHLYDAFGFAESATVAPGQDLVTVQVEGVGVGLATCYDVRFPTLFTALADRRAQVVCLPASWGAGPGKVEQWQLLTRARALDSTSYVLATGQADPRAAGVDLTGRETAPTGVGFSCAVGPDGSVLGALDEAPGLLVTDLDLDAVDRVRAVLPVLANRRPIPPLEPPSS